MVGVTKPEDVAWLAGKLTPHPLSTWLQPVHLRNGGHQGIKKTFVVATSPPTVMMGFPNDKPENTMAAQPTPQGAWKITFLLFLFMLVNFADKIVVGLAAVPIK